jgi:hypothetical protein
MPVLAEGGGDTLLAVRLQPRAGRTEVAGLHDDALKIRVAALPAAGAANAALCALLAHRLGIAPSRVTIERGATSRTKLLRLKGLRAAEVAARLNLPT